MLTDYGAICIAYTMDIYGTPLTPKIEVPDSPVQMSQRDIDKVLTSIAVVPFSPILAGYRQPAITSQDIQCSIYGNIGHIAEICQNSPMESTSRCFCCREVGQCVAQCSQKLNSPTPVVTPENDASSAFSATSPAVMSAMSPATSAALTANNS